MNAVLLDRLNMVRVLVVGDVMLDRYLHGTVGRISPEAPVPVVHVQRSWATPGGAGHVAASLAGLGCQAILVGLAGQDPAAAELVEALNRAGVSQSLLVAAAGACTVTKTRVLAGGFHQMLRLDQESEPDAWGEAVTRLGEQALERLPDCDALVLADYDKGALTSSLLAPLIARARHLGKPVVVDPKKPDLTVYRGASVLTPNVLETERALGRCLDDDEDFETVACQLRQQLQLDTMLITRGAQGMTGADSRGAFQVPAKVREVSDVTGAGDTVVAVLAAALAQGADVRDACQLASVAAGLAVTHSGTYVVKAAELRAALGGQSPKVASWDDARHVIERERQRGRRIVFTNGCFDLLHAGHLYSLQQARAHGDFLVIGLNSDVSIRQIKGPGRPVIDQHQRATLLAGLACVDLVVLFDEPTPLELIRHLLPDILVKGGDHAPNSVVGGDLVRSRGGQVVTIPRIEGLSTTTIVEKLRAAEAPGKPA